MKIGDKLLCKKDGRLKSRLSYLRDNGHGTFQKNKWYEISDVHEGIYIKEYSEELAGKPYKMIRVRANYGVEIDFIFDRDPLEKDENLYDFHEYFLYINFTDEE